MKKTAGQPRLSLLLSWLLCTLVTSSCATTSPPAKPAICPSPSPAPSNVMRTPNYEQRSRALLFKSPETPMTRSEQPKP